MQVSLTLPREPVSVSLARGLLGSALERAGVVSNIVDDIKLAVTEACTNAYQHADAGDTYELTITLDDERCTLDVIDHGRGFTEHSLDVHTTGESPPEAGRGVDIIRALVDLAAFDTVSEHHGGVVHIEKQVAWKDQSPWLLPKWSGTDLADDEDRAD